MITYKNGDMFTSTAEALGHGVNCKGVMGAGIAAIFRKKFPLNYKAYKAACARGLRGGDVFVPANEENGKIIFNIASQEKPGAHAQYDFLREGINTCFLICSSQGIASFAIPRIGAGIGGLEWERVDSILNEVAADYPGIEMEVWSL